MGYIKHHAIIVTGFDEKKINEAHFIAKEIFKSVFENSFFYHGNTLVTEITNSSFNGYRSFMVSPDGSKEGWNPSDDGDKCRLKFINWLRVNGEYLDYIEVVFGGDDKKEKILNSRHKKQN